jgi:RHS repeat-associated protein
VETGLDYFGARYLSSAQGRFTSPDPLYFQKEMIADPQRFNGYAYGRNNPLTFMDPTGEAIQLSDDPEERKKQLEGLRNLAGDKNGNYLYENKVGDHYYVGIMAGGQSGQDKDFGSTNAVAADLQKIINDPHVASLHLISKNEMFDSGPNQPKTLSAAHAEGAAVTLNGKTDIYIHDPTKPYAPLDLTQNSTWGDIPNTFEDVMGHELGHFLYRIQHPGAPINSPAEKQAAVDLENKVRRLEDKNAPVRTRHDSLIP